MHIRAGDVVRVIAGASRGVEAKVLSVNRAAGKALVEGVNRVYKHVRRDAKHPQGGRLSKEMPMQLSNLQLVCTACRKPARTGVRINDDGSKERICKKCGASLGEISPAKAARAKQGVKA